MRLCTDCWRVTSGSPSYCNRCGSSFDVKLCPRGHRNPRAASACAECGSKDLSAPASKAPILIRPVLFVLFDLGPGVLMLIALVIYVVIYAVQLMQDPNGLLPLMILGFVLGSALWLWMRTRDIFRRKR